MQRRESRRAAITRPAIDKAPLSSPARVLRARHVETFKRNAQERLKNKLVKVEDAARELPNLPLEDALQLVHLYFERGSPKAEPAARRWLVRYLSEGTPSLRDVAKVTASLTSTSLKAGSHG
jgi:hypothetical protein